MARLPLRGLETFDAVARHLSFSRAADELFVSQGAVSKQIKLLEANLGAILFRREKRSPVELTAAGRVLAMSVKPAFEVLRRAAKEVRPLRRTRPVTVTTVPSLAAHWLIPRLDQFRDEQPGIEIHIQTGTQLVDLERGDVDLAIRYGPGGWPRTTAQRLSDGVVIPVCSPELVERQQLKAPADLSGCTLLHNVSTAEWRFWFESYNQAYPRDARELVLQDLNVVIQSTINGQGVALVPEILVQSAIMSKVLTSPFAAPLTLDTAFYVVYDNSGAMRGPTSSVVQWLLSQSQDSGSVRHTNSI